MSDLTTSSANNKSALPVDAIRRRVQAANKGESCFSTRCGGKIPVSICGHACPGISSTVVFLFREVMNWWRNLIFSQPNSTKMPLFETHDDQINELLLYKFSAPKDSRTPFRRPTSKLDSAMIPVFAHTLPACSGMVSTVNCHQPPPPPKVISGHIVHVANCSVSHIACAHR